MEWCLRLIWLHSTWPPFGCVCATLTLGGLGQRFCCCFELLHYFCPFCFTYRAFCMPRLPLCAVCSRWQSDWRLALTLTFLISYFPFQLADRIKLDLQQAVSSWQAGKLQLQLQLQFGWLTFVGQGQADKCQTNTCNTWHQQLQPIAEARDRT